MTRAARRPDPPPLESDDVRAVAAGTAAWALGLLVLVVLRLSDSARVETWWMVMCGYGLLLGAVGVRHCHRRHVAIERDKALGLPRRD
jgi:hypothetical protein